MQRQNLGCEEGCGDRPRRCVKKGPRREPVKWPDANIWAVEWRCVEVGQECPSWVSWSLHRLFHWRLTGLRFLGFTFFSFLLVKTDVFGCSRQVPSILIEIYEKMATADSDLVLSCAFNFPGPFPFFFVQFFLSFCSFLYSYLPADSNFPFFFLVFFQLLFSHLGGIGGVAWNPPSKSCLVICRFALLSSFASCSALTWFGPFSGRSEEHSHFLFTKSPRWLAQSKPRRISFQFSIYIFGTWTMFVSFPFLSFPPFWACGDHHPISFVDRWKSECWQTTQSLQLSWSLLLGLTSCQRQLSFKHPQTTGDFGKLWQGRFFFSLLACLWHPLQPQSRLQPSGSDVWPLWTCRNPQTRGSSVSDVLSGPCERSASDSHCGGLSPAAQTESPWWGSIFRFRRRNQEAGNATFIFWEAIVSSICFPHFYMKQFPWQSSFSSSFHRAVCWIAMRSSAGKSCRSWKQRPFPPGSYRFSLHWRATRWSTWDCR